MGDSYEDGPDGWPASRIRGRSGCVAAAEALLRAADKMSDVNRVRLQWEMEEALGSESMSEAQIALILARAAPNDAAASNDGDPRSGRWIDAANASIESASEALAASSRPR